MNDFVYGQLYDQGGFIPEFFSLGEMDTNVYLLWCMIGGELDIPPKAIVLI